MKAIELLKLYRKGLVRNLKVEIRQNNYVQKIVIYKNSDEIPKEELLQQEVDNWFIGSEITDGELIIDIKE